MEMFKELTQLHGVSGYETAVAAYIREKLADKADELITDPNGSVIAFFKGTGENKKRIQFAAHTDEIGLQVIKIEQDGRICFKELGTCFTFTTYLSRVRFKNGTVGIVSASVPPEQLAASGPLRYAPCYIDIGLSSKEEVEKLVDIGDVAVFEGPYQELAGPYVTAKAIDDRVGCYMQLKAMEKIDFKPKNDIYLTFTVQEEVGTRGGQVTAQRIQPDIGVAVDVTPSADRPGELPGSNTLGKGAAIKISDTCSISDEYLVSKSIELCKANNIPYQKDVICIGGTDAGAITLVGGGIKTVGFSVVTRYTHGPNAIVNTDDINATVDLIAAFMNADFEF